ncbi:hypothetical protein SCUP515_05762 [Seiridium cupressi]
MASFDNGPTEIRTKTRGSEPMGPWSSGHGPKVLRQSDWIMRLAGIHREKGVTKRHFDLVFDMITEICPEECSDPHEVEGAAIKRFYESVDRTNPVPILAIDALYLDAPADLASCTRLNDVICTARQKHGSWPPQRWTSRMERIFSAGTDGTTPSASVADPVPSEPTTQPAHQPQVSSDPENIAETQDGTRLASGTLSNVGTALNVDQPTGKGPMQDPAHRRLSQVIKIPTPRANPGIVSQTRLDPYTQEINPSLQRSGPHTNGERLSTLSWGQDWTHGNGPVNPVPSTGRPYGPSERFDRPELGQIFQEMRAVPARIDTLMDHKVLHTFTGPLTSATMVWTEATRPASTIRIQEIEINLDQAKVTGIIHITPSPVIQSAHLVSATLPIWPRTVFVFSHNHPEIRIRTLQILNTAVSVLLRGNEPSMAVLTATEIRMIIGTALYKTLDPITHSVPDYSKVLSPVFARSGSEYNKLS